MSGEGDECERASGRAHDEVQPRLADALDSADDAVLLASLYGFHHQSDAAVPDAAGKVLRKVGDEREVRGGWF